MSMSFPAMDEEVCRERLAEAQREGRDVEWGGLTRAQAVVMVGMRMRARAAQRREEAKARIQAQLAEQQAEEQNWL